MSPSDQTSSALNVSKPTSSTSGSSLAMKSGWISVAGSRVRIGPALLRLRCRHQHSRIAADQLALDDENERRRRLTGFLTELLEGEVGRLVEPVLEIVLIGRIAGVPVSPELAAVGAALVGRVLAPQQLACQLVVHADEKAADERAIRLDQRRRVRGQRIDARQQPVVRDRGQRSVRRLGEIGRRHDVVEALGLSVGQRRDPVVDHPHDRHGSGRAPRRSLSRSDSKPPVRLVSGGDAASERDDLPIDDHLRDVGHLLLQRRDGRRAGSRRSGLGAAGAVNVPGDQLVEHRRADRHRRRSARGARRRSRHGRP